MPVLFHVFRSTGLFACISENMGYSKAQIIENAGICTCQMALQLVGEDTVFYSELFSCQYPADLTVSKSPGTSYRIKSMLLFFHLSLLFSFMKLVETF